MSVVSVLLKRQRVRGPSFKHEYLLPSQNAPSALIRMRAPSMIQSETDQKLIPPKSPQHAGRLTVVLDLDETLIYAREGPLYTRPGTDELLAFLAEHCETVVWTAGIKSYAKAVIRTIDTHGAVQHAVYRHKKWFNGSAGGTKNLTMLGRDMNTTIMVDNTPDCIRGFEGNGILVTDYEGGELEDNTIPAILHLLRDLVHRMETTGITVPEYMNTSQYLTQEKVPTDSGDMMSCFCLDINNPDVLLSPAMSSMSLGSME